MSRVEIPAWLVLLVGRLVIENEALKQPVVVPEKDGDSGDVRGS